MDPHSFFTDPDPAVSFNGDPDPAAFSMRIRIQLKNIVKKLPFKESAIVEKTKKKKTMELVQIYSKNFNNNMNITNSLRFFLCYFSFFPLGSRRRNECGSGPTALNFISYFLPQG